MLGIQRDGRSFDHRTLETFRLMAMERMQEGERPPAMIASYGFCRTTIYKWMHVVCRPGGGLRALRSTRATGRPRSLTPRQGQQVFRWVNGKDPRQYGSVFGCGW
jgi:transposase